MHVYRSYFFFFFVRIIVFFRFGRSVPVVCALLSFILSFQVMPLLYTQRGSGSSQAGGTCGRSHATDSQYCYFFVDFSSADQTTTSSSSTDGRGVIPTFRKRDTRPGRRFHEYPFQNCRDSSKNYLIVRTMHQTLEGFGDNVAGRWMRQTQQDNSLISYIGCQKRFHCCCNSRCRSKCIVRMKDRIQYVGLVMLCKSSGEGFPLQSCTVQTWVRSQSLNLTKRICGIILLVLLSPITCLLSWIKLKNKTKSIRQRIESNARDINPAERIESKARDRPACGSCR